MDTKRYFAHLGNPSISGLIVIRECCMNAISYRNPNGETPKARLVFVEFEGRNYLIFCHNGKPFANRSAVKESVEANKSSREGFSWHGCGTKQAAHLCDPTRPELIHYGKCDEEGKMIGYTYRVNDVILGTVEYVEVTSMAEKLLKKRFGKKLMEEFNIFYMFHVCDEVMSALKEKIRFKYTLNLAEMCEAVQHMEFRYSEQFLSDETTLDKDGKPHLSLDGRPLFASLETADKGYVVDGKTKQYGHDKGHATTTPLPSALYYKHAYAETIDPAVTTAEVTIDLWLSKLDGKDRYAKMRTSIEVLPFAARRSIGENRKFEEDYKAIGLHIETKEKAGVRKQHVQRGGSDGFATIRTTTTEVHGRSSSIDSQMSTGRRPDYLVYLSFPAAYLENPNLQRMQNDAIYLGPQSREFFSNMGLNYTSANNSFDPFGMIKVRVEEVLEVYDETEEKIRTKVDKTAKEILDQDLEFTTAFYAKNQEFCREIVRLTTIAAKDKINPKLREIFEQIFPDQRAEELEIRLGEDESGEGSSPSSRYKFYNVKTGELFDKQMRPRTSYYIVAVDQHNQCLKLEDISIMSSGYEITKWQGVTEVRKMADGYDLDIDYLEKVIGSPITSMLKIKVGAVTVDGVQIKGDDWEEEYLTAYKAHKVVSPLPSCIATIIQGSKCSKPAIGWIIRIKSEKEKDEDDSKGNANGGKKNFKKHKGISSTGAILTPYYTDEKEHVWVSYNPYKACLEINRKGGLYKYFHKCPKSAENNAHILYISLLAAAKSIYGSLVSKETFTSAPTPTEYAMEHYDNNFHSMMINNFVKSQVSHNPLYSELIRKIEKAHAEEDSKIVKPSESEDRVEA